MKLFIFLGLFVTLCAAQRIPPNNILQQAAEAVRKAKSSVDDILFDMRHFRTQISMSANNEISSQFSNGYGTITNLRDTRLKYIKEKLEQAKASGIDAEDCLNTVTNNVRTASTVAYTEISRCRDTAEQQWKRELQKFDNAQATGQTIKNSLDRVALDCYQSNTMQMATCMITKVASINLTIREYKQSVEQMQRQIENNKRSITSSQYSCNSSAISKYRTVDSDAIYAAANCLKN